MSFNPSRLVLARKRRGISKSDLSRRVNVSLRALGYYEAGERVPPAELLQVLALTLEFPVEFFFGPDIREIVCESASFRSLSTMTASQRDAAIAAGTLAVSFERWLCDRFDLPSPAVPALPGENPEIAAQMLRAEWGLGERPVPNSVHLAELHGIRVFSLPIDSTSVDAFSVWYENVPFIFLNTLKSGEHGRMDVAHEIGHLCMHRHGETKGRQIEFEATRFASAFLMPARDVLANVRRNLKLSTVQQLKTRWRVSAIALVVRLYHLGLLTEWQYRNFCIELSKTNQRKKELNGIHRESSQVLDKSLAALRSEGITRNTIARELSILPSELNALVSGLTIAAVPDAPQSQRVPSIGSPTPTEWPALRIVRSNE
jgi:Zn-dependent peptidase ImmA (M78 family)/transcriptional regulator with XRE-family HTH domain